MRSTVVAGLLCTLQRHYAGVCPCREAVPGDGECLLPCFGSEATATDMWVHQSVGPACHSDKTRIFVLIQNATDTRGGRKDSPRSTAQNPLLLAPSRSKAAARWTAEARPRPMPPSTSPLELGPSSRSPPPRSLSCLNPYSLPFRSRQVHLTLADSHIF